VTGVLDARLRSSEVRPLTRSRAAAPLLLGTWRPPLSIDISCPRSAANPPHAAAAVK